MWFNSKKTNPELIDDIITKELSNSANGKMILLHGAWGSGKTFRWEKKIKPNIKNKKHKIYVSLFGMQDAEDLKREIYMQAMNINFFKFLWKFIVLLIIFLSILGYLAHKDILSFKSINSSDLMQIIPVLVFFLLFLIFFSKQILLFTMDKIIGLFESIYNLLSKGEKTSDLEKELFPEKYLTEFEKMLSEFFDKNYLYYRHKDIIAYYNKIQEILKRKTKLFSSYYTMVSALNRYAWLATCTYKQTIKAFLAENCTNIKKTILSAQIAFEALKRSPIDLHNIDNEIYEENIKLINQNLQRAALSYLIDEINDTPDTIMHHFFDYTDGKNKYYKDIVCILLMSDHKFFNLEELAETNYSDFIHICERIAEFVLEKNNSDYKLICELSDYPETAYNNLLDKLLQILKEQANGMPEYSSEAKNYARYVKLFKRRKMI